MWKEKERWTAAALLLAMVVVTGLCWYVLYIRQQFYDEGTRNLLETYEQVDKAFTIFSRSNWNMLNEWGKSLQAANEEGLAEERLRSYEAEREIWRYSSVYLFNENCEYWSIRGKHEKVDHLWTAFEEMYRTGKPTVSSYIMRSGERRVVYAAPIAPVEIDGTTYTSLAVSYRNKTIEELIGGSAYGGQSDCYIIHPDGDVMLSEEPKSEIEDWMDNLFDYLQKYAQVDAGTLTRARQDVAEGRSGSLSYWLEDKSYYLVYQLWAFRICPLWASSAVTWWTVECGRSRTPPSCCWLGCSSAQASCWCTVSAPMPPARGGKGARPPAGRGGPPADGGPGQHRRPDRTV